MKPEALTVTNCEKPCFSVRPLGRSIRSCPSKGDDRPPQRKGKSWAQHQALGQTVSEHVFGQCMCFTILVLCLQVFSPKMVPKGSPAIAVLQGFVGRRGERKLETVGTRQMNQNLPESNLPSTDEN